MLTPRMIKIHMNNNGTESNENHTILDLGNKDRAELPCETLASLLL